MAKATVEKCGIKSVTLELSKEEVETLRVVVDRVGGCPSKSRRRHMACIGCVIDDALMHAGEKISRRADDISVENRAIYFLP